MNEYPDTEKPILNLFIDLNVKDEVKAKRIINNIQKAIDLPVYIEELYKSDVNEFTVFCYIISEHVKPNDSIVWALTTLDKIGEEWYIECPNLKHKEYWKFKGTRLNEWNSFKINGIKKVDFELTDLKNN